MRSDTCDIDSDKGITFINPRNLLAPLNCTSLLHFSHFSVMSEALDTSCLMSTEEDVLKLWRAATRINVRNHVFVERERQLL